MEWKNWNGWIVFEKLEIPEHGGIKVEYLSKAHHERWLPASLFPTLSEEALFAPSNLQDWNHSTSFCGLVLKRNMDSDAVYWNYHINFHGIPEEKHIPVRVTIFGKSGKEATTTETVVTIDPGPVLFINDWHTWKGDTIHTGSSEVTPNLGEDPVDGVEGWNIFNDGYGPPRLSLFGKKPVQPIYWKSEVEGLFDLYICWKDDLLECDLELPGIPYFVHLKITPRVIPGSCWWKEILIGRYSFTKKDTIGIHQPPATIYNPTHRFGDIYYLKLVPVDSSQKPSPQGLKGMKDILFYSEPYSLAYYHRLQTEEMVQQLFEEYASLKVDAILTQMGRIGSAVIYPSKIAQWAGSSPVRGDDKQYSTGVSEMMKNLNILEVMSRLSRKYGIKFLPNVGVNSVYRGSPLESKYAVEHPELFQPPYYKQLDYSLPEVREFAVSYLLEMAEYDISGLSIDHNRYPYYQTAETITAFHRLLVERLGTNRRDQLEISIRFPADNPDYFTALPTLLKEKLVDTIIPSRLMCTQPPVDLTEYVALAKRYSATIYGAIDGWTLNYTSLAPLPRPAEMAALAQHYIKQGATGIFFYQSEQILSNIFLRRFVSTLKP
jgi:hypothetical protein